MPSDWALVGELARVKRKKLGLTQVDIQNAGGPSTATIRQIENGTYASEMQRALKRAYESALQWPAGSIDALLGGGPAPDEGEGSLLDEPGEIHERFSPSEIAAMSEAEFEAFYATVNAEALRRMRQAAGRHDELDREQENPS